MKFFEKSYLFFLIILCILFFNGLNNAFVIDDHAFFNNERITNIKYLSVQFLPDKNEALNIESGNTDTSYYRPLAHVIPMICYQFFKLDPTGYRIVNIILLWLAGVFIFQLVLLIFNNKWLAFLTTFFYLIHPVNGFFVNYITASVYPAQVIFICTTLLCFLKIPLKRAWLWWLGGSISFLLSLWCHETSLVIPGYLFVILFFAQKKSFKESLLKSIPLLILAVTYLLFRLKFASVHQSMFSHWDNFQMNIFEYGLSFITLIVWFLEKLVIPQNLVYMWITPVVRSIGFIHIVTTLLIGVLIFLIIRKRKECNVLLTGIGLFVIGFVPLIPGSLVTPRMGLFIEPHWFAFSSLGFFLCVGFLCSKIINRRVLIIILVLITTYWSFSSLWFNHLWSDEKAYCKFMLKQTPSFKAPAYFLGISYLNEKDFDNARYYFQQSLIGRYKDWIVFNKLGNIELQLGNYEESKKYYKEALLLEPNATEALTGYGVALYRNKEIAASENFFKLAVKADPFLMEPKLNLILAYIQLEKFTEANPLILDVLKLDSGNEKLMQMAMFSAHKSNDAAQKLAIAKHIARHSNNPRELFNAGQILDGQGLKNEGFDAFKKSIQEFPEFINFYLETGAYLEEGGNLLKAKEIYELGQKLAPNNKEFNEALKKLRKKSPKKGVQQFMDLN